MDKMYRSTRNKELVLSAKEAILKGIADDGGLFVYDELDQISLPLKDMMDMTYEQMAEVVLTLLLPDFKEEEIKQCVKAAYEKQFDEMCIRDRYMGDCFVFGNSLCTNDLCVFAGRNY